MRIALPLVLLFAACSDDAPPSTETEPPFGSWRMGIWTCLDGCSAATPEMAGATHVEIEIESHTVRWYNAAGAVVESATGSASSSTCWTVPSTDEHGAFDLCSATCEGDPCVQAEAVSLGGQSWRFDATR